MTENINDDRDDHDDDLAGFLEFSVLLAVGLSRVNLFQKPNPFISIKFNDQLIGKTEVKLSTRDPTWNAKYKIEVPRGMEITKCVLELFIYHLKPPETSIFLGYRKITGSEMLYLGSLGEELNAPRNDGDDDGDDDDNEDHDEEDPKAEKSTLGFFDLHSDPFTGQKQKTVKGKIKLWGFFHPHRIIPVRSEISRDSRREEKADDGDDDSTVASIRAPKAYFTLQFHLHAASEISNIHTKGSISGCSNPFCILKMNSIEIYRTGVIANTLNPHWHHEMIEIRIPKSFDLMKSQLEVELWHSSDPRKSKRSRFLGCVVLYAKDYCNLAGCDVIDAMCMLEETCMLMEAYYEKDGIPDTIIKSALSNISSRRASIHPSASGLIPSSIEAIQGAQEQFHTGDGEGENDNTSTTPQISRLPSRVPITRTTSMENLNTSNEQSSKVVKVDVYDKGLPKWLDLQPSTQRSAAENSIVQGKIKICLNFKLPLPRELAIRPLPNGLKSALKGGLEIISVSETSDLKRNPKVVISLLSIRGLICQEALKFKNTPPEILSNSNTPSKSSQSPTNTDDTIPPQLFCVLRDSFGEIIGKTMCLGQQFTLRWKEERFWITLPSRGYHLFPVILTIEVYCRNDWNQITSLGTLSLSANDLLETISDSSYVLGTPGGIGPYGNFQTGVGLRWFEIEQPPQPPSSSLSFEMSEKESENPLLTNENHIPLLTQGEDVNDSTANTSSTALVPLTQQPSTRKISLKKQSTKGQLVSKPSSVHTPLVDNSPYGALEIKIEGRNPLDQIQQRRFGPADSFDDREGEGQEQQGEGGQGGEGGEEEEINDDEIQSVHSECGDEGQLTLIISNLNGMGLDPSEKKTIFGKKVTKVYCQVWINGNYFGQTTTIKLTTDTSWNESFHYHLPEKVYLENCHIEVELFKQTACKISATNPYGIATYSAGTIQLTSQDIVKLCASHQHEDEIETITTSFPLIPSLRTFSIDSKPSPVTGSLDLKCQYHPRIPLERLAYVAPDMEDEHMDRELEYTPAKITLMIHEAANLANADLFGRSDPFVIVIWNGEEVGRTYIIQDTLNPIWKDQLFYLPIPRYKDVLDCQLELHVYDDQTIGQNQFLGCVLLKGPQLKHMLSYDSSSSSSSSSAHNNTSHWYDLQSSKYLSKKQNSLVQGSLLISGQFSQSHRQLRRWSVDHFKITVYLFNAENLSQIEATRKPNVFCVLKWKGEEVGRTSVVRKALNPKWDVTVDRSCQFTIYYPDHLLGSLGSNQLEFLLYHSDLCKETELLKNCLCLGRGVIAGDLFVTILQDQSSSHGGAGIGAVEITPMSLQLDSFTRESVECRPDTFNKISPQGRVDVGITINNSEQIDETQLHQLLFGDTSASTHSMELTDNFATTLVLGKRFDSLSPSQSLSPSSFNSTFELGNTFNTPLMDTQQQLQLQESDWNQTNALTTTTATTAMTATSSYKMFLDHQSGSFYYLNEETGDSSWDKPLDGSVTLYHTEEQLQHISATQLQHHQHKQQQLQTLREVVSLIRYEHQENKQRLEHEKKLKNDREIHLIWQKALTIASKEENECNISWLPCNGIDKILYSYETLFGVTLRTLRLVGIELQNIPTEFCLNLTNLELLSLANNNLTTLPETLYHMNGLQTLDIRNNKLISLPKKIGLMAMNLARLEMCNNQIVELPNTLASLIKLKKLDLENNKLIRLPENLDLLINCEVINVTSNELTRLPRCLGKMKKLKLLSGNKNKISYLPFEMCRSQTIEILRLCSNKITSLPDNIGQMRQLRELWLDHNDLNTLPGSVCYLTNLQLLKLEGNVSLQSPGYDLIGQGAQAVVQWAVNRYVEEGYWRRKHIVQEIQNCLQQITDMKITDSSQFESSYVYAGSEWFALDMNYFWNFILFELQKKWRKIIDTYENIPKYMTLSFPYTQKDVMWALQTFHDAYGPIYRYDYSNFKRCSCRDPSTGKRRVCVPPCKGYMCRKKCSLIKHEIVLQHEKEMRLWRAHKNSSIAENVKRAENEAIKFLKSDEGKIWIAEMAYERAEEIMNMTGLSHTYEWRDQLAEKRKQKIIKKFIEKKKKIEKIRSKKSTKILLEIEELKNKNKVSLEGGYSKESIQSSLQALYDELANLPENEMLTELQKKCEEDCNEIDDDLIYTDTSEEEEPYHRETYLERKVRLHQEATQAILQEVQGAVVPDLPELENNPIKDFIYTTIDVIPPKDRREVLIRRNKRRLKRLLRRSFDMVNTRLTKLKFILNGNFHEIEQELEHETYVQYVSNAAAVARRKAEREFYVLGRIRSQWKGLGLEAAFRGWKKYVKQRVHRQHADIRQQWRQETKQYESDLIAIHLAQAQLTLWEKFTDVYSDKPFWKNWQSHDVTWEEPKLEDYLPTGCNIPKIPIQLPPNISEETSESEVDEDYRPRVRTGLMLGEGDDEDGDGDENEKGTKKDSSKEVNILQIKNGEEGSNGDDEDEDESQSQLSNTDTIPSKSEFLLQNGGGGGEEDDASSSLQLVPTSISSGRGGSQAVILRQGSTSNSNSMIKTKSNGELIPSSASYTSSSSTASSAVNKFKSSSSTVDPNDFTKQRWLPLIPSATSQTPTHHLQQTNQLTTYNQFSVSLPNIPTRALTTYHPNSSQQLQQKQQSVIPQSFTYGPDSLRAGKLHGRVGRPLFLEDEVKSDDEMENKWGIMTSDAERLLGQYDPEPKDKNRLTMSGNADVEKQRALEAVKLRREQGKTQRHHTYMKQRNRRPRIHEEIVKERKQREAHEDSFQEPTAADLLAMLNSNPNEVWRSDQIKQRTELATKAVKLQKRIKERAVKEGLIEEKKKGYLKTALLPLLNENYNPEEEEEEGGA